MNLHQSTANGSLAASIHRYDVVVVGGGIAGIAVAELLARRSNLSIKVLDEAPQLGMGASGKLEGWFHTGALYSCADDAQTFVNCLNGVEDLINLYSSHFPSRCNMILGERGSDHFLPTVVAGKDCWFEPDPIYFIQPGERAPEIALSGFNSDRVLLGIQRQRVLGRLEAAFGRGVNWQNDGQCRAPTYAEIEGPYESSSSLEETSGLLRPMCERFDRSFGVEYSDPTILRTLDAPLNTVRVMRDLVSSALNHGVDFETGVSSASLAVERFGPARVRSLVYHSREGQLIHLRARLFVFAVGSSFESYLPTLNLRVRLKTNRSPMVVASPALSPASFVRLSIKEKFHFNHLHKRYMTRDGAQTYSMLASSGFTSAEADMSEPAADVDSILESAERYFGDQLYSRKLYTYDCAKTEFIAAEDEKRRYSYWIEAPAGGNYFCILPGKFSFFPTVAYQSYLRVKSLLQFEERQDSSAFSADETTRVHAHRLVADHYPIRLLAAEDERLAADEEPSRTRKTVVALKTAETESGAEAATLRRAGR